MWILDHGFQYSDQVREYILEDLTQEGFAPANHNRESKKKIK